MIALASGGAIAQLRPEMLREALAGAGLFAGAVLFGYLWK